MQSNHSFRVDQYEQLYIKARDVDICRGLPGRVDTLFSLPVTPSKKRPSPDPSPLTSSPSPSKFYRSSVSVPVTPVRSS